MALLTCTDLAVGYDGKKVAEGLDFEVERGDYLYIIGENGAGKSTLMRTLLGLTEPVSGSVVLGDGLKRNEIGYLPQQTELQRDFPASVWEIVLSGCLNRRGWKPFYGADEKNIARESLDKVGMGGYAKKCYRELSGGQQQRVLLARALCAARKFMILDEPVSGLDPVAAKDMYELVDHLNKRHGITVIMVSHDMDATVKYAGKILMLGKENFFGTRDEFLKTPAAKAFTEGGDEE